MSAQAIEQMNRRKKLVDKVMFAVEDWLDDVARDRDDYGNVNTHRITIPQWSDLRSRIGRLLGEIDK